MSLKRYGETGVYSTVCSVLILQKLTRKFNI